MVLGDAHVCKISKQAYVKFEQGYKQKDFLNYLFTIFKKYVFMKKPGIRIHLNGKNCGKIKSLWFKTFSHICFTKIYNIFYRKINIKNKMYNKKKICEKIILKYLTYKGLAYWIMCDGSLQKNKKTMILHTQGFDEKENYILSNELNIKFNLNTKVIIHKKKYYVIKINYLDLCKIILKIQKYIHSIFKYKMPKI